MSKIKIAIVGIGNCASSLVQGLDYYKDVEENMPFVPGLMHNSLGGYLIRDIEVVAAFDVNANKIGKDIAEAIWVDPNNAKRFVEVSEKRVIVSPGALLDSVAPHMRNDFPLKEDPGSVLPILEDSGAEMLINFLPVGSHEATAFYANACLEAGVAFINGMPEFIASNPEWNKKFVNKGIPCAGDDIQSQIGATIIHRVLVGLIRERGQTVDHSYQLNIGGNMDFYNMTDPKRLTTKRISKTEAVIYEAGTQDIKAGPAEYVPHLKDNKIAYINIKGRQFGAIPFEIDLKLSVEDSPNDAGVMVDVIRAMKISLDRKLAGYQEWSAYFFKHPLRHYPIRDTRRIVEDFIRGTTDD